jgi:F-type H+-transporting ATPase subunit epsilon
METALMNLKVLLPFRIFSEIKNVKRMVAETAEGSFGLLPHRLDCVAALTPGIFSYETEAVGINYLALDEGLLIKAGQDVHVSVRNAFGGTNLGKLYELVEKEFINIDEKERDVRTAMAKLESGFMRSMERFYK